MQFFSLPFAKLQGLGNDFVLVDFRLRPIPEFLFQSSVIKHLCDRHRGIGGDGVIFLLPSRLAQAKMRIFNADGNEAESCGNGLRCAARFLWEHPIDGKSSTSSLEKERTEILSIETQMGVLSCKLAFSLQGRLSFVEVSMGAPSFFRRDIPMLGLPEALAEPYPVSIRGKDLTLHPVSMGNPHAVIFLEKESQSCSFFAKTYGPVIEQDPMFPSRCNVGFARRSGPQNMELAVWERGCGLTQACGTGACAAVVAACQQGLFSLEEWVTVHLPGGELEVKVLSGYQNVLLRGFAIHVFSGTIDMPTS